MVNSDLDCKALLTYAFGFTDPVLKNIGILEANQLRIDTNFVDDILANYLVTSRKEACVSAVVKTQPAVAEAKSCFKVTFKPEPVTEQVLSNDTAAGGIAAAGGTAAASGTAAAGGTAAADQ